MCTLHKVACDECGWLYVCKCAGVSTVHQVHAKVHLVLRSLPTEPRGPLGAVL